MASVDRSNPAQSSPAPGADGDSPGRVALEQSFDLHTLYALRSAVAAHASDLGAAGDALSHLLIIAGELAGNAVRHGGGKGTLRLWRDGGLLYCEVRDDGPGLVDVDSAGAAPPPPEASSGRGLWIVRQLADGVVVTPTGSGTTVTAAVAVDDPQ
jgi:anti-sigma regulatory factor (Ser/Thr protein kinase)